ncbi:Uncharacterised protein [Mycobacteroides abscessus subsp. massiliense]|nr:Uncharacterised protein [Mycobacteroides abscessus subsp. massiliense]
MPVPPVGLGTACGAQVNQAGRFLFVTEQRGDQWAAALDH